MTTPPHRAAAFAGTAAALLLAAPGAPGQGKPDEPARPSPAAVKAWRGAGARVGWVRDVPPSDGDRFWLPWREAGGGGAVPAFRFERDAAGVVAKLPDPGAPFGLDFHCGFYAGVGLTELTKLKSLRSLCIGGVQGDAYADLTPLAALKDLQGLYLFYLPVTDAQLKHLSGMKGLRVLDLSSTRVTDAGLKELCPLTGLRALNLSGNEVTDEGVRALAELKGLRRLDLTHTGVTEAGARELARRLPGCWVER